VGGGAAERDAAFAALGRLGGAGRGRAFSGWDRPEGALDPPEQLVRLKVADGDDECVGGVVVAAVVAEQVVAGDGAEVGFVADHHVAVGVGAEGGTGDLLVEEVGGIVLGAGPLGEDDGPLRLGFLGVEEGVRHPVGFDAEREVDLADRQRLEVGGPIVRCEGVEDAAVAGDVAEDLALGERRRALELHVLDPVRETGEAGQFVAAADAVPDQQEARGAAWSLPEEDAEAVGEGSIEDGSDRGHRVGPWSRGEAGSLPGSGDWRIGEGTGKGRSGAGRQATGVRGRGGRGVWLGSTNSSLPLEMTERRNGAARLRSAYRLLPAACHPGQPLLGPRRVRRLWRTMTARRKRPRTTLCQ
jgi:hypothetical protein